MDLLGSKTEQNLRSAFAGESQARNKYSFFASQAKKEGYNQIADIFQETAENEKEHAKIWFKLLNDDGIPMTVNNLDDAANGELYEWSQMYKKFAEEAKEEGFYQIAVLFEKVAQIEKMHQERYLALLENIKTNQVFSKNYSAEWICTNCGHTLESKNAPEKCPVCSHPTAYFKLRCENY
ncbi:MAG: rubrerythrin family protein [Oscillospiraceae bacterium]|nr:rubrerythrin family protein [Oscillospiraceae bacterium]